MNVLLVSDNYPSNGSPNKGAFVFNLAQEMQKSQQVTIIAPIKLHDFLKRKKAKPYGKETCKVYRPVYPSFGNKKVLGIDLHRISLFFQKLAVWGCYYAKKLCPDIIYCHFLVNALTVLSIVKKGNIPLVIASGESNYSVFSWIADKKLKVLWENAAHIICVSPSNFSVLSDAGYPEDRMSVIPNAVNFDLFQPLDKIEAKRMLGFNDSKFVVGFVGHFIDRKGPNRLIQAVDFLEHSNIIVVCVGEGAPLLDRNFVVEISPVSNAELPPIINAFDVFVLPTLSEGHCNVIEEVKACCVPVISSKGTTVESQIDNKCGVLIDPQNVAEISDAISTLYTDKAKRMKMVNELSSRRYDYTLSMRVSKINALLETLAINRTSA